MWVRIGDLLVQYSRSVLLGAIVALFTWYVAKRIAEPYQDLIKIRKEALRVAERYWMVDYLSSEDTIATASRAFLETATSMRSEYRSLSWLASLLLSVSKYDFEGAAKVLSGLNNMVGQNYAKEMRQNQLDALYVCLHAGGHLSCGRRKEIRDMLQKAIRESAA